jgi:hypothetical protein
LPTRAAAAQNSSLRVMITNPQQVFNRLARPIPLSHAVTIIRQLQMSPFFTTLGADNFRSPERKQVRRCGRLATPTLQQQKIPAVRTNDHARND